MWSIICKLLTLCCLLVPFQQTFLTLDSFPWNLLFSGVGQEQQPRKSVPDDDRMEQYLISQVGLKRFGCRILNKDLLPLSFDSRIENGEKKQSSYRFYRSKEDFDRCSKRDLKMLYSTLYYADPDEFGRSSSECEVATKEAKKFYSCLHEATEELRILPLTEFEVISKFFNESFGHCSLEIMPWSEKFYLQSDEFDDESLEETNQLKRNETLESLAICRKSDLIFLYNAILSHSFEEAKLIARSNRSLPCKYSPQAEEMVRCIEKTSYQFSRLHAYLDQNGGAGGRNAECETSFLVNQRLLRASASSSNGGAADQKREMTKEVVQEAKAYNALLKSLMMNELEQFVDEHVEKLNEKSIEVLNCLEMQPINPFIVRLLRYSNVKQDDLVQSLWVSVLNRKTVFIVLCSCTAIILLSLVTLIMISLVKVTRQSRRWTRSVKKAAVATIGQSGAIGGREAEDKSGML